MCERGKRKTGGNFWACFFGRGGNVRKVGERGQNGLWLILSVSAAIAPERLAPVGCSAEVGGVACFEDAWLVYDFLMGAGEVLSSLSFFFFSLLFFFRQLEME